MRALLCAAPPLGGSPIALFFLSCHPPAAVVITVPLVTPLGERKWINRNVCHSEDERRPAANGSAVMRQVTVSFPQPSLTSRWLFKEEISHLLGPRLHFRRGDAVAPDRERRSRSPGAVRSVAHSPLNVPVRPESRSTAPSCPLDPFRRLPPLPPLAAAVTKRSYRTAVSVRPPLPTARGGSRDSSRHLRWLRSHDSEGGGSPNPIPEAHLRSVGSLPSP
ncbi:unnamed protein product [Rangifer tarandus platyrhynchus]|uniref:Uncharacterized protein n=1 Tax=Rangifer tarandus platyrhynchus TaxID=3082113 RepID=A0AC59YQN8_RANTA